MIFRTNIETIKFSNKIEVADKLFFIGSCFSDNIGNKLKDGGLDVQINPYGTTYNPMSVTKIVNSILDNKSINSEDTIKSGELHYSFLHHSFIYGSKLEELQRKCNEINISAAKHLKESKFIFITLGTAWIYIHKATNKVVNNCHKIPSREFQRRRLSVDEVVETMSSVFDRDELKDKEVIITVSPIRHIKDGLTENMLSKSTLRVAVDILCTKYENVKYFPSFEIMTDDLRDYRFYKADMVHPSDVAIDYIFDIFKSSVMTNEVIDFTKKYNKLIIASSHRSTNPLSQEHLKFVNSCLKQIDNLQKEYPQTDVSKLKNLFEIYNESQKM